MGDERSFNKLGRKSALGVSLDLTSQVWKDVTDVSPNCFPGMRAFDGQEVRETSA